VNSQGNIEQKEQCWRHHNNRLQSILQSHRNKNSMVLAQRQVWRPVDRIKDPDMNPHSYGHLIFDKHTQNIQWRKDGLFNKCWQNWISTCRKLKLNPCLSPCTSINSKWIRDLNVRPKTLKLVQERVGNALNLHI
jgi:hypothetical protein